MLSASSAPRPRSGAAREARGGVSSAASPRKRGRERPLVDDEDERVVTSEIKGKDAIMDSIKEFLGKGK